MKYDPVKMKTPIEYDTILGHSGPVNPGLRVKYYDFCRPDKFSRDQIRTVQIMHETFARLCTTTISAQLRSLAHVHVAAVDQMTYEEFIRSIPNPTLLSIINLDPLKGSSVLQIDPPITFAIIDRLMGGRGRNFGSNRDLTDIEQSALEEVVLRLMGNLRESWSTVIDLRPRLGQIETNPMFAQIVPPNEMVILVMFDVMIGDVKGQMNFCIPYLTIEPIISKLSAKYWYSSVRRDKSAVARDVSGLKSRASVFFEAQKVALADIHGLKKNSLVKLNDFSTAVLSVGSQPVCRLITKKDKGRFAFDVSESKSQGMEADDRLVGMSGRNEEADKLERLMQAPLEKISREMKSSLEAITGKIGDLQKRQEELGDQLFHNGRGGDGEPAEKSADRGKPFLFVRGCETAHVANFIQQEHPQTIALILSFLEPGAAAEILAGYPEETQADIAERIAVMERCSPEVIRDVEKVLEKKMALIGREKEFLQESDAIIGILNVAGRKLESNIIDRLEKTNPELAEQIKRKLFVFEDTVLLDDKVIRLLLARIDPADLLLALKAVNEKTKEKFLHNMKAEAQQKFTADFLAIGPVRLVDADKAQQRIIGLIRQMEEAGEIIVARSDEYLVE
jgi:flagellar motor switch protein FliM